MTLSQFKSIVQSSFLQILLVGAVLAGVWLLLFVFGFLASFCASAWNASTKAFDAVGNILPSFTGLLS